MKYNFNRYMMAAFCAATVIVAGCQREGFEQPVPDELIVRIADKDSQTKASYDDYQGKFEWNTGDQIVVPYSDDRVKTFDVVVDATDPSKGTILSSTKGTGFRYFYAVYPASAWVNPSEGDTAPKVLLPTGYNVSIASSGEFSPIPMVAENDPAKTSLDFLHVGGLLRITCRDLPAETKSIVVTFDSDITGTYLVDLSDASAPFIKNGEGTDLGNTVTFTIEEDATAPIASLVLNLPVPCGSYNSVLIEALDGTGTSLFSRDYKDYMLVFERHHGKRLSFKKLNINYVFNDDDFLDVTTEYTGGLEDISIEFESYMEDEEGNKIPIPFSVEFSESEDGPWTTERPSWVLMGADVDFNGSVLPQRIDVALSPSENSIPMNRNGIPIDAHTEALQNAIQVTPDLSKYDVASRSATASRNTANCYVVNAPGTYIFPLVYGNGIKEDAVNTLAYHGLTADVVYTNTDNPHRGMSLANFKDHLDQNITTPYIAGQHAGKTFTAELLWMDAPGLISNVTYNAGGSGVEDDYISFDIDSEDICQGNAVIGVLANGVIAWSWHIWVTDAAITTATSLNDIELSKLNLGWCDQRIMEVYEPRQCYLRIVQTETGYTSRPVLVKMNPGPTVVRSGNSPFYAMGRKDPFPGSDGNMNLLGDKACYPVGGSYLPKYAVPTAATIGEAIQNPDKQYINSGTRYWTAPYSYDNLWDSTWKNSDGHAVHDTTIPITKTVYDPCPVGFRVMNLAAVRFTAANLVWKDNFVLDGNEMGPGRVYTIGDQETELFFPATGSREIALTNPSSTGIYMAARGHWSGSGGINPVYSCCSSYMRYTLTTVLTSEGSSGTYQSIRFSPDN